MVHVECAVLTDNTLTDRSTVYMLRDYYVTIVCVLEQAVVFKCRLETCSLLYCKSTNPITVKRACRYRLSPHEGAKNSRPLTLISQTKFEKSGCWNRKTRNDNFPTSHRQAAPTVLQIQYSCSDTVRAAANLSHIAWTTSLEAGVSSHWLVRHEPEVISKMFYKCMKADAA